MPSSIYRINKAGAYAVGHFKFIGMRIDLGNPKTCRHIDMNKKEVTSLLEVLGIDWEDGDFLSDLLVGQYVLITDDIDGYPLSIGDPYGNRSMELKEARHA